MTANAVRFKYTPGSSFGYCFDSFVMRHPEIRRWMTVDDIFARLRKDSYYEQVFSDYDPTDSTYVEYLHALCETILDWAEDSDDE